MTEEPKKQRAYPPGKHPNSLAALTGKWDTESAKRAQLAGAKKRSENARKKNEIRETLKLLKSMQEELAEDRLDSVEVLRLMAYQKLEEGDHDGAIDIFTRIAEFEKPKLARVEQKVESIKADTMSDEELMAALKKAMGGDET